MLQDIRYALRGFARSPGFVLAVVVTIGLALGLNTTMFTSLIQSFAVAGRPHTVIGIAKP